MTLFKDMLHSDESLFRDTIILDFDFQPKILKFRENEQARFATAIKPLLQGHTGRNLFVYGEPGVGKTTACKQVLKELQEETDDVLTIYVNCWKENTTYKVFYRICEDLGLKFLQNKRTNELFSLIKTRLNKSSAVFVFDEVDKLEESDFLYSILEDIYRKSIILLTNYRDSYSEMDERIRSRFSPEFLFFKPYNEAEIKGILEQRKNYAFVSGCWDDEAFKELVEKCTETKDVRVGLYLMREAGTIAEENSSRKIEPEHVAEAVKKVDDFHIKSKDDLETDIMIILSLIKNHSGKKIGDIYSLYNENNPEMSYKSFQRRINKLKDGRFITTEKVSGKDGMSTILHYTSEKKLTEF